MGTLLFIIIVVAIIWYIRSKKKGSQSINSSRQASFGDGPEDNLIIEFTDAFVVLSNHHYEACHYELTPSGVKMRFQDYAEDSAMVALISNNNNKAYLEWLDYLGDTRDCGWILRQYGHAEGDYWKCEINMPVSKATADKAYSMLSKSSRLHIGNTPNHIGAHKYND